MNHSRRSGRMSHSHKTRWKLRPGRKASTSWAIASFRWTPRSWVARRFGHVGPLRQFRRSSNHWVYVLGITYCLVIIIILLVIILLYCWYYLLLGFCDGKGMAKASNQGLKHLETSGSTLTASLEPDHWKAHCGISCWAGQPQHGQVNQKRFQL